VHPYSRPAFLVLQDRNDHYRRHARRKIFGLEAVTVSHELAKEISRTPEARAQPQGVPRPVKRR
jgi:hypothetical protein